MKHLVALAVLLFASVADAAPFCKVLQKQQACAPNSCTITESISSGCIIGEDSRGKLVLTCAHAVDPSLPVRVQIDHNEVYRGQVLAHDKAADLSLIAFEKRGVVPTRYVGDSMPQTGATVYAWGCRSDNFSTTVVGFRGRHWIIRQRNQQGDSGGPVCYRGRVVAVMWGRNDGTYTVPLSTIRSFLEQNGGVPCPPQTQPVAEAPAPPPPPVDDKSLAPIPSGDYDRQLKQLSDQVAELVSINNRILNQPRVPGPAGPAGPQGSQGPKGDQGERGDQGIPGPPGEKGSIGLRGERGPNGVPGAAGAKGADGRPGTITIVVKDSSGNVFKRVDGVESGSTFEIDVQKVVKEKK